MKFGITIILFVLMCYKTFSQKVEEITHREINIHYNDSSVKANILLEQKKIMLNTMTNYYWYYNNAINSNQSDYKGKLLDGEYQVTSKNGQLITKGKLKRGIKLGAWKQWNENGELLALINWENGVKNGKYKKFKNGLVVEQGVYRKNKLDGNYQKFNTEKLIEKGTYKNGLLHGKQVTFQADTVLNKTYFKKGIEIFPKEKSNRKKETQSVKESKEKEDSTLISKANNTKREQIRKTKKDEPTNQIEKENSNKKGWKFWKKDQKEIKAAPKKVDKTSIEKKKEKLPKSVTDKEKKTKIEKKEKQKIKKDD